MARPMQFRAALVVACAWAAAAYGEERLGGCDGYGPTARCVPILGCLEPLDGGPPALFSGAALVGRSADDGAVLGDLGGDWVCAAAWRREPSGLVLVESGDCRDRSYTRRRFFGIALVDEDRATGTLIWSGETHWGELIRTWSGKALRRCFGFDASHPEGGLTCEDGGVGPANDGRAE